MFFYKNHKNSSEDLLKSKTYCVYLFSQVATTPSGFLRPCCHFDHRSSEKFHISEVKPSEFFNSPYMKNLRQKVSRGESLKTCVSCYSMEKRGIESMRQRSNREAFHILKKVKNNIHQKNIYSFDLRMGNLCNLGCIMCHSETSSFLEQEKKRDEEKVSSRKNKKNIQVQKGLVFQEKTKSFPEKSLLWYKNTEVIENLKKDTRQILKLWLLGGEPLINMSNLSILENFKSKGKSLEVEVSSNITVLNKKMLDLLSGHNTIIKCSLDGVGSVSDYIRYPSNFKDIEKNFKDLFKTDIGIQIVFSLQVFNLFNIKDFYFWLKEICHEFSKPCSFSLENMVLYPEHLAIRNLPESIKTKAIRDLEDIIKDIKGSEKQYIRPMTFSNIINYLKKETGDPLRIKEGWKSIENFDRIRKNSWFKVIPWMKEVLEN